GLLRIAGAVEAEPDVLGGQLLAVVEDDAGAQVEGVDGAVLAHVPARGQVRYEAGAVVADADELVVDVDCHPDVGVLRVVDRVERLGLNGPPNGEGVRLSACVMDGCPDVAGGGVCRGGQHQEREHRGGRNAAGTTKPTNREQPASLRGRIDMP